MKSTFSTTSVENNKNMALRETDYRVKNEFKRFDIYTDQSSLICLYLLCLKTKFISAKRIVEKYEIIIIFLHYINNRLIGLVGRVFANDPGNLGSIPGRVIPKTLKMVLDNFLLNTQQYKVRIKGKVEQFWERSSPLPLHLDVVAIEKGAFWSPSTWVANFTLLTLYKNRLGFVMFVYICKEKT